MRMKRIVCLVLILSMLVPMLTWMDLSALTVEEVLNDALTDTGSTATGVAVGEVTAADLQNFGYGYNITSGKPLEKGNLLKNAILDMSNPTLLASIKSSDYHKQVDVSETFYSARELSSFFGSSYGGGINANISAVTLDVGMLFNRSESIENAISERYELYSSTIEKKQVWTTLSVSELRNYLTPQFVADMMSIDGEADAIIFLQKYGTHLFPGYRLGGKMTVTNYMTSSSETFDVADGLSLNAKMGVAMGAYGGGASFSFSEQYAVRENNASQSSKYKHSAIGGATVAGLTLDQLFTYNESVIGTGNYAYEKWEKALDRHENLDIVGVAEGMSAIPIWELFPQTSATAKVRKDVLAAYAKLCGDKLSEYNEMYPYFSRDLAETSSPAGTGEITGYMTANGNVVTTLTRVQNDTQYTVVAGSEIYLQCTYEGVPAGALQWRILGGGDKNVIAVDGTGGVFRVIGATGNEFVLGLYSGDTELDYISFKIAKKEFSGGLGTEQNPYLIATVDDLSTLLNNSKWWKNTYYYLLVDDIDASTLTLTAAMSEKESFDATLDGGLHTIRNFKCNATTYPVPSGNAIGIGLIGVNRGTVKNLKIENFTIELNSITKAHPQYMYGGVLVGNNIGEIENCVVYNSHIYVKKYFAAQDNTDKITESVVSAGGLVGYNTGSVRSSGVVHTKEGLDVRASFYISTKPDVGSITVSAFSGGLIGRLSGSGEVRNCFTRFVPGENGSRLLAQVEGTATYAPNARIYVGGLIGMVDNNAKAKIISCVVDIPQRMYANPTKCDPLSLRHYAGTVIGSNDALTESNISGCYVLRAAKRPNILLENVNYAPVADGIGVGTVIDTSGNSTIILKDSLKYADVSSALDEEIWAADADGYATVAALDIVDISVSDAPAAFPYGMAWSPIGMTVKTVNRRDSGSGSGGETTPHAYIIDHAAYDATELGSYSISIKAAGYSKTAVVAVERCRIVAIVASDDSTNKLYMDEKYDPDQRDISVMAVLSNGTKIPLHEISGLGLDYVIYPADTYSVSTPTLKCGDNSITVAYGALKCSYIVKAEEKKVEEIEILKQPTTKNYPIGGKFSVEGMTVLAHYTDGTSEIIDNGELELIGDTIVAGTNAVIISYGEYKTQTVSVLGYVPLKIESLPTKTAFEVGTPIDYSGLVLSYSAKGSSYVEISPEDCTFSAYTLTEVGENVITVSYEGSSAEIVLTGIARTHTVKFVDAFGQTISEKLYETGATVSVPTAPYVEGQTFVSWDKTVTEVTEDVTYTAIYRKNVYTVSFVGFNGVSLGFGEYAYGDTVTAPTAPKVVGYTFISWDKEVTAVTGNATYTAIYRQNEYTVSFIGFDGKVLETREYVYGDTVAMPVAPRVDGYTFVSWDKEVTAVTGAITYTAIYQKNVYTVNFVGFNGVSLGSGEYAYGDTVKAPTAPKVVGYTFISWDKEIATVTGNATYTAIYQQNEYTVSFIGFDGKVLDTREYVYGDTVAVPTAPKVTGYTFVSWDKAVTAVTGNVTYSAVYQQDIYTVIFVGFGGERIGIYEYAYGDTVAVPVAPKVAGYTFVSWDKEIKTAAANTTYTAIYKKNLKGDVNGDGEVTQEDAILLLQYIHFKSVKIDTAVADVNGDGKITTDDAIYINSYLTDPNGYPL